MAWTAPMTYVSNTALTAAQMNTFLRDNMNETMTAKATAAVDGQPGGFFVTTDVNSITERRIMTNRVDTTEQTASTTYTDLTTVGPSVTVETGTAALVMWNTRIWNDTGAAQSACAYSVSGASDIPADDAWAMILDGVAGDNNWHMGCWDYTQSLTPGTNTFTLKYRAGGAGTAGFRWRFLAVWPL